jgi:hypothetical protein
MMDNQLVSIISNKPFRPFLPGRPNSEISEARSQLKNWALFYINKILIYWYTHIFIINKLIVYQNILYNTLKVYSNISW